MEWEYRKIVLKEHHRRGDDIDLLSAAGQEGWELVAITSHNVAYLKRVRAQDDVDTGQTHAPNVAAKYRDPATGDTWSGRGRMATWLKHKQEAGEDIEKFRV